MRRIQWVRIVLAVLILTVPAGLPARGAQLRSREDAPPARLAALARSAAALFWGQLTGLRAKEGCGLDPSGGCVTSQSTAETDAGCGLDPHGGCVIRQSTTETDEGCWIDPNGIR